MDKVVLVEGYHQSREQIVSPAPEEVPEHWELWNAARPFPCHVAWRGGFLRGVFYGALDPEGDRYDELAERARDLDARQLVWVPFKEAAAALQAFYDELAPGRVDVKEHADDEVARSFLRRVYDGDISIDGLLEGAS